MQCWPPVTYLEQQSRTHERVAITSVCWHPSSGLIWVCLANGSIRAHDLFLWPFPIEGSVAREGALCGDVVQMCTLQPTLNLHQGRRASCLSCFDRNVLKPTGCLAEPFTRGPPLKGLHLLFGAHKITPLCRRNPVYRLGGSSESWPDWIDQNDRETKGSAWSLQWKFSQ